MDPHELKTPDEILHKALEKETQARDFYAELTTHCSVEFVRELLEELRNEEYRHMQLIKAMLSRLESGRSLVSGGKKS